MTEQYLKDIYFDPSHPGAFAGPDKLYRIVQREGIHNIGRHRIKQWLQDQDAYSLQRSIRYKFKRNRIVPTGRDALWDMDLADVSNTSKHNDGIKFWLIVIDVFSRYLWVQPLKDKTHQSVLKGLKEIFKEGRVPQSIRSDKGSEFANRWVKQFMKKNDVYYYNTQNETKANYAERVIRTLKNMVYRYFSHTQTYKYKDILQDLVANYNDSPHRSLNNRSPASINQNEAQLWKSIYIDVLKPKPIVKKERSGILKPSKYKYKIGDFVRLSYLKHPFNRDYQEKWTEEVFIVRNRVRRDGIPIYKVKDWNGEEIKGNWYQAELQKVNKDNDNLWKIENVIKKRKRAGKTELYVKWMGWPKKFNSWVSEDQVQDL